MPQVNVYSADNSGRVVRTQWVDDPRVSALQEGGGWADQSGQWHGIPQAGAHKGPFKTVQAPVTAPVGRVTGNVREAEERGEYYPGWEDAHRAQWPVDPVTGELWQPTIQPRGDDLVSAGGRAFLDPATGEVTRPTWGVVGGGGAERFPTLADYLGSQRVGKDQAEQALRALQAAEQGQGYLPRAEALQAAAEVAKRMGIGHFASWLGTMAAAAATAATLGGAGPLVGAGIGAVGGAARPVGEAAATGDVDWGKIGVGAGTGAATGYAAGAGLPPAARAGIAAAGTGARAATGQPVTLRDVLGIGNAYLPRGLQTGVGALTPNLTLLNRLTPTDPYGGLRVKMLEDQLAQSQEATRRWNEELGKYDLARKEFESMFAEYQRQLDAYNQQRDAYLAEQKTRALEAIQSVEGLAESQKAEYLTQLQAQLDQLAEQRRAPAAPLFNPTTGADLFPPGSEFPISQAAAMAQPEIPLTGPMPSQQAISPTPTYGVSASGRKRPTPVTPAISPIAQLKLAQKYAGSRRG